MLNRWRTRGVIDWTTAMIAEPEYDIAWNRVVNIAAWFAVLAIPEPSRSVVGFVASSLLWTMERLQELLYRFRTNVSAEKVRYYTAYHSLLLLASGLEGMLIPGQQDVGRGRRLLRRRFRRATGIRLVPEAPVPAQKKADRRISESPIVLALSALCAIAFLLPPAIFLDLMFTDAIVWFVRILQ